MPLTHFSREARRAASYVDSVQRDIDAQRKAVLKDQALKQLKLLREAMDDAQRVLEGL